MSRSSVYMYTATDKKPNYLLITFLSSRQNQVTLDLNTMFVYRVSGLFLHFCKLIKGHCTLLQLCLKIMWKNYISEKLQELEEEIPVFAKKIMS